MAPSIDLSVLLPVHAGARTDHLEAALESLRRQTRPADQVVVVQDGPLPESLTRALDRAARALPVVRVARASAGGVAEALESGLDAVTGDWVARMDSDDIALPDRFAKQLGVAAQGEHDVVGGAMLEFDVDPDRPGHLRRMPVAHREIARAMVRLNPVNHPTAMFRADAVRRAGGYRDLHGLEDYDLWVRMLAQGSLFHNIPEPVLLFRADQAQRSRRRDLRLVRSELELQRSLVRNGVATPSQAVISYVVRNGVRLLPGTVAAAVARRRLAIDHDPPAGRT